MKNTTKEQLEFKVWQQSKEIERLKSENDWAKRNIAVVIEKDTALLIENKALREKIQSLEKVINTGGPIETYPDVFTKSSVWKDSQKNSKGIFSKIIKKNSDKTVRLSVDAARDYVKKELMQHG